MASAMLPTMLIWSAAVDAVALARLDIEAAWSAGALAPALEGRALRQPCILVDENARRLRCIQHSLLSRFSCPWRPPQTGDGNASLRAFDAAKRARGSNRGGGGLVVMRRRQGPGTSERREFGAIGPPDGRWSGSVISLPGLGAAPVALSRSACPKTPARRSAGRWASRRPARR